jgi:hypothetical protein
LKERESVSEAIVKIERELHLLFVCVVLTYRLLPLLDISSFFQPKKENVWFETRSREEKKNRKTWKVADSL